MKGSGKAYWGWGIGIVFLLVALGGIGAAVIKGNLAEEIALPVLLIVAVMAAWFVLILFSLVFRSIGLDNPTQALGLPDGSIRAVVAMSLIVLFATVPLFLYGHMGRTQLADRLNDVEEQALVSGLPKGSYIPIRVNQPALNRVDPNTPVQSTSWTVYYSADSPASTDFAKQILTVLGTLVTSVVSFFFGAAVANSAAVTTAAALTPTPAPTLTGVSPNTFGANTSDPFTITGSNLNSITSVTLTQGPQRITATSITSSPTEIHGTLRIPAGVTGSWDIEAATADGKIVRLPAVVTLTA